MEENLEVLWSDPISYVESVVLVEDDYYTCSNCGVTEEKEKFYWLSDKQSRDTFCNDCRRGDAKSRVAKYKANKLQATPAWADLDAIHDMYYNCPDGYHVDHIVPLQNDTALITSNT